MKKETLRCSFCEKSHFELPMMFKGPSGVSICSDCIKFCIDVLVFEFKHSPMASGNPHALEKSDYHRTEPAAENAPPKSIDKEELSKTPKERQPASKLRFPSGKRRSKKGKGR